MKYYLLIWNELYKNSWNFQFSFSYNEKGYVFVKKGEKQLSLPKGFERIESDSDLPESAFIRSFTWLAKTNFNYSDEIYVIDNCEIRWNDIKTFMKNRSSNLNWSWIDGEKSSILEIFKDRACGKCKIFFEDRDRLQSHQRSKCEECKELICDGNPNYHEKVWQFARCKSVNCSFQYRKCSMTEPKRVAHDQSHPQCSSCKTDFLDQYQKDRHESEKRCYHCKELKCRKESKPSDHENAQFQVCSDVGCSYDFFRCTKSKHEKHLAQHPKCYCGCEGYLLTNSMSHQEFSCKSCTEKFANSAQWLQHAEDNRGHLLNCPVQGKDYTILPYSYGDFNHFRHQSGCGNRAYCQHKKCRGYQPYFSGADKMRDHMNEFAFSCEDCDDCYFLCDSLLSMHRKNAHPVNIPAPPHPKIPDASPAKGPTVNPPPAPAQENTKSSPEKLSWGSPEEGLTKLVQEYCVKVNFPIWTLTSEERETLRDIRNEIKGKLSSAILFDLHEQGSMTKNTAVPGYTDLDFILGIRNNLSKLEDIKNEIRNKLSSSNGFRFMYGKGKIETWLYRETIFFDVVIVYGNDERYKNWEQGISMIKGESPNLQNYIRAIKYWCKRLNAGIRSYSIECIGKLLFKKSESPTLIDFCQFIIEGKYNNLPDVDGLEDFTRAVELATQALAYFRRI